MIFMSERSREGSRIRGPFVSIPRVQLLPMADDSNGVHTRMKSRSRIGSAKGGDNFIIENVMSSFQRKDAIDFRFVINRRIISFSIKIYTLVCLSKKIYIRLLFPSILFQIFYPLRSSNKFDICGDKDRAIRSYNNRRYTSDGRCCRAFFSQLSVTAVGGHVFKCRGFPRRLLLYASSSGYVAICCRKEG